MERERGREREEMNRIITDAMAARYLMKQLRLCCVDSVRAFYAALKQALP
jgi:hypothetical protein